MQAPTNVHPLHFIGLDMITEVLEELQLHAPKAHAPRSDQLLGFDYGRLEHQLDAIMGHQPSQEDVRCLTFSLTNVMT